MDKLSDLGVDVELPDGWDGLIYQRISEGQDEARRALHAANFPLPPERGDYGGGVQELMGQDDVLVTLVEFEPENSNSALFSRQGPPARIDPDTFSPTAMPRAIPGQAGAQFFFTVGDRAFSLFVVIGSYADRDRLAALVNSVIGTLTITP